MESRPAVERAREVGKELRRSLEEMDERHRVSRSSGRPKRETIKVSGIRFQTSDLADVGTTGDTSCTARTEGGVRVQALPVA